MTSTPNNRMITIQHLICTICTVLLVGTACSPQVERRFLSLEEMGVGPTAFDATLTRSKANDPCRQQENYEIDLDHLDHFPMQYVRINIHWMNSEDSTQNIPEAEIEAYTRDIVFALNYALENNKKSWIPHNNDIPIHPTNFRYVLTGRPEDPTDDGIYYHYDDSLYYYVHWRRKHSNLYKRDVFDKYGVQLDTVLNLFMMPHHRDSVASKSYPTETVGVALRNAVKVAAPWKEVYGPKDTHWRYRGVINHEIGHIFSLRHAWTTSDGCDDTPRHNNRCWSRDVPGCDTLTSNNVMDYAALQLAWTPCQISRVHRRLMNPRYAARNFLEPRRCVLDPAATITIREVIDWDCHKDLLGHLVIAPGGVLTIRCNISLPENAKVTIRPGGKLILDGGSLYQDCGLTWQGIEVEQTNEEQGQLELLNGGRVDNITLGNE
ncbi:MAG: M43 family zinc metalloprotease [Bacteroidota bacterium]